MDCTALMQRATLEYRFHASLPVMFMAMLGNASGNPRLRRFGKRTQSGHAAMLRSMNALAKKPQSVSTSVSPSCAMRLAKRHQMWGLFQTAKANCATTAHWSLIFHDVAHQIASLQHLVLLWSHAVALSEKRFAAIG